MRKLERGFVLSRISFSETSIIVKVFTEHNGLKSFMVKGGCRKYGSIFQALTFIEFHYYQKNEDQLANLYDPVLAANFQQIYFNPIKQSIVFFETEFLMQCLHEGQVDEILFDFILRELEYLNQTNLKSNYLIYWILNLSFVLGIKPQLLTNHPTCFDLVSGELSMLNSTSPNSIQGEIVQKIGLFLSYEKEKAIEINLNKEERKKMIEILLRYFNLHISTFKKINSFETYSVLWYD